jgi:hypothetical protein
MATCSTSGAAVIVPYPSLLSPFNMPERHANVRVNADFRSRSRSHDLGVGKTDIGYQFPPS